MTSVETSKQERRGFPPDFENFIFYLTRLSLREVIWARRTMLKYYDRDGKPRKESTKRRK